MALFGISIDKENPEYTIEDLKFWMPNLKGYLETDDGQTAFDNLYPIANKQIFESIFGTSWKYAMSLCIAHYLTLIAKRGQATYSPDSAGIAAADTYRGIMSSASIGSFSKTYDLDRTTITTDDAKWWNLTSYGAELMALYKTKAAPSIFVSTPTPRESFDGDVDGQGSVIGLFSNWYKQ